MSISFKGVSGSLGAVAYSAKSALSIVWAQQYGFLCAVLGKTMSEEDAAKRIAAAYARGYSEHFGSITVLSLSEGGWGFQLPDESLLQMKIEEHNDDYGRELVLDLVEYIETPVVVATSAAA